MMASLAYLKDGILLKVYTGADLVRLTHFMQTVAFFQTYSRAYDCHHDCLDHI